MAGQTFFFYDLETSGISPRDARIMQFAGQRTDLSLKPIGEPYNYLIKMTEDTLPEPDAILITGITPQATLADGITEAEFLQTFHEEIVQPDTIFVGYNSIRFDDRFMHFSNYRNFYDPYGWQWENGCSKWDMLDVVRLTRALKPDGIKWPFASDGKPTNRLEFLTSVNKLDHSDAHDALNDVYATIAVAKLIQDKQPELFTYLLEHRSKKAVQEIIESGRPFTYATGRYPSQSLHTSAAVFLAKGPSGDALVYDLRHDPTPFLNMTSEQLAEAWKYNPDKDAVRLPVKTVKYNHCPAVAPGFPKDAATQKRIDLTDDTVMSNLRTLQTGQQAFVEKLRDVIVRADAERAKTQIGLLGDEQAVDTRLYDGFVDDRDKSAMRALRAAKPDEIADFADKFHDERLQGLLPLYKARNFPSTLSDAERKAWEQFCAHKLYDGGQSSRLARYFERLSQLAEAPGLTKNQQYLLEELQLYGQSILPVNED